LRAKVLELFGWRIIESNIEEIIERFVESSFES